jgi:TRAP-type mannitol/chloroaromatic compound transport system permease small subunit
MGQVPKAVVWWALLLEGREYVLGAVAAQNTNDVWSRLSSFICVSLSARASLEGWHWPSTTFLIGHAYTIFASHHRKLDTKNRPNSPKAPS